MRPEAVYWLVRRLRRRLAGRVPERFTPHWFRHTHATALLLSWTPAHVIARRLGNTDVQTTLNIYAWVTDDAELGTTYFTIPQIPDYLGAFRASGCRGRVDFRMLPEPLGHELAFCVWRIIELGGLVPHEPLDRLARCVAAVLELLPARERARRTPLMAAPATTWIRELLAALTRARGRIPSARKHDFTWMLRRCYRLLCFAMTRAIGGGGRSGICSSTRDPPPRARAELGYALYCDRRCA
jgi:Phage integrase family